jgi:hypothetical protein
MEPNDGVKNSGIHGTRDRAWSAVHDPRMEDLRKGVRLPRRFPESSHFESLRLCVLGWSVDFSSSELGKVPHSQPIQRPISLLTLYAPPVSAPSHLSLLV